jgi:hypothetical protein
VLAGGGHLLGGVGRGEVEGHPDHPVGETALRGVADLFEYGHHLLVGGQHVGDEPGDPLFPGGRGQMFQQYRGDPPALVRVLDEEGHLRLSRLDPVVADHRHHLRADRRDERDPVHVVDVGEPGDLPIRETRPRTEETEVDRLVGQPGVEGTQPVGVGGPNRAYMGGTAVRKDNVRLPVSGILSSLHRPESRRESHMTDQPGRFTQRLCIDYGPVSDPDPIRLPEAVKFFAARGTSASKAARW